MEEVKNKNLIPRQPVVVIMGHVDHGKSSILEAIKDLKITAKESGGITQHIGAYEIEQEGKKITFLDTPGHEAFSAMRSRGAHVADIAILVIAAEESIKPQTKEAIEHIRKAGIPMIVALNKIDKPTADAEKVKRELLSYDVVSESLGGTIPTIKVSAKTKQGITELLEMILLISDLEHFSADISAPAKGVIIESYMDSFRGPVATIILKSGALNIGDYIGTQSSFGKIKGFENFQKDKIGKAKPGVPVVVLGFEGVPTVGEEVKFYNDLNEYKKEEKTPRECLFLGPELEPDKKILKLIIKVDVSGSLEAISEVLKNIPQEKVALHVLKAEVGDVNDSDIKMAVNADAKVIGFRIKTSASVKKIAEKEKITVINFNIIYELAQAVRNLLEKSLQPETVRVDIGQVKVLAIFKTEKGKQIIGGKVTDGVARRGAHVEVIRDEENIGSGKIIGLQQGKKETAEVAKRTECGMIYCGEVKVAEGDLLNLYVEEKRRIEL